MKKIELPIKTEVLSEALKYKLEKDYIAYLVWHYVKGNDVWIENCILRKDIKGIKSFIDGLQNIVYDMKFIKKGKIK